MWTPLAATSALNSRVVVNSRVVENKHVSRYQEREQRVDRKEDKLLRIKGARNRVGIQYALGCHDRYH